MGNDDGRKEDEEGVLELIATECEIAARQKVVIIDVPAGMPGKAIAEEVCRAKGREYGLSKDEVVDGESISLFCYTLSSVEEKP